MPLNYSESEWNPNSNQSYGVHRLQSLGAIFAHCSGVYSLGFFTEAVINKIKNIIHHHMSQINAAHVSFPTIQPKKLWETSGRSSGYGSETFKTGEDNEFFLAPTAEEVATVYLDTFVSSHKQLPMILYQISEKFRDEIRPRGISRSKHFIMKDAYSFDIMASTGMKTYSKFIETYINLFKDLELASEMLINFTNDTGEIGGEISHEFLIPMTNGDLKLKQNPINFDCEQKIQIKNVKNDGSIIANINTTPTTSNTDINYMEIAHIFNLGTMYSKPMKATFRNRLDSAENYHMGCYGIGINRVLDAVLSKHKILPWNLNPCFLYLVARSDEEVIYDTLCNQYGGKRHIWFDNRNTRLDTKLKTSTLLGVRLAMIYENEKQIIIRNNDTEVKYNNLKAAMKVMDKIYTTNYRSFS